MTRRSFWRTAAVMVVPMPARPRFSFAARMTARFASSTARPSAAASGVWGAFSPRTVMAISEATSPAACRPCRRRRRTAAVPRGGCPRYGRRTQPTSVRLPNVPFGRRDLIVVRGRMPLGVLTRMATSPTLTTSVVLKGGGLDDRMAVHGCAVRGAQVLDEQVLPHEGEARVAPGNVSGADDDVGARAASHDDRAAYGNLHAAQLFRAALDRDGPRLLLLPLSRAPARCPSS